MLDGLVVDDAWAVGKQFFAGFGGDWVLRVHLGIYGAWSVHGVRQTDSLGAPRKKSPAEEGLRQLAVDQFPPEPVGQVRLRVMSDTVVADLRGPTACEVISHEEAATLAQALGPDPLVGDDVVNRERFIERMSRTATPVGIALMNQKIVSGQLGSLWDDWAVLLRRGVKTGVMVTRDDLSPAGAKKALRDRKLRHFVYKREGEPCLVCGHEVVMAPMQARKLYYCPHCQTAQ
jgi:formamidopyrimidine-DNA glycosylase